ncbi:MAG: AAA family ATPase [Desulfobacterales bacterium]|nr:AAA family ATPase [Desulfobacterales bacterium]
MTSIIEKGPVIIAVCGKGGVGKTSISALLTRALCNNKANRVLAIDADPAIGLSFALGVKVYKTVDDIRNNLIARLKNREHTDQREILSNLDYELFESLEEKENLAFLAIGRPETRGCYCRVNDLLKRVIQEIATSFDFVIIDAEAGIEQINRRVMEMVTHLLLVTDTSAKSVNVIKTIRRVAEKSLPRAEALALFNRVRDESEVEMIRPRVESPVIGSIPEDETIRVFDRDGKSFFNLPDCDAGIQFGKAVEQMLAR